MLASGPEPAKNPALAEAFSRWQEAAGPFWPYVCATPFLSDVPVSPLGKIPRVAPALRRELLDVEPGCALVIDLPPERTLGLAIDCWARRVAVVPVIQRWAAVPAVIASDRLLGLLVTLANEARTLRDPRSVVLLLDGGRMGPAGPSQMAPPRARPALGRRFDNRYQYPICRFPPPSLLLANGIRQARWVPEAIAPDLQPYAAHLASAGIAVAGTPVPPAGR